MSDEMVLANCARQQWGGRPELAWRSAKRGSTKEAAGLSAGRKDFYLFSLSNTLLLVDS